MKAITPEEAAAEQPVASRIDSAVIRISTLLRGVGPGQYAVVDFNQVDSRLTTNDRQIVVAKFTLEGWDVGDYSGEQFVRIDHPQSNGDSKKRTRGQEVAEKLVMTFANSILINIREDQSPGFYGWAFQLPKTPRIDPVQDIRGGLAKLIDAEREDAVQKYKAEHVEAEPDIDDRIHDAEKRGYAEGFSAGAAAQLERDIELLRDQQPF